MEQVEFTASLRDEFSEPADRLKKKVGDLGDAVERTNRKTASSTQSAMRTAGGSMDDTGRKGSAMADAMEKSSGRTRGAFSGIASAASGLLAAGAGVAIAGFASKAVGDFAQLEDATAAASVIFGKDMAAIQAQAEGAAATMGMSQSQVIDAANTFGTYGKAAGLAGSDLAGFSTEMTTLAADMASFKGKSPEEAITAIGSALRGETEPIRAFGVMLDDASLRAQAMKMGLISTTKDALTPQQKSLAAHQLILAQTTDAQGDFARTADSTANVQKRLQAETQNLSAQIGEVLAPAFTWVREKALEFVAAISQWIEGGGPAQVMQWMRDFGPYAMAAAGALLFLIGVTKAHAAVMAVQATGGLVKYLAQMGLVQAATKAWTALQWLLNLALNANPIGIVVIALAALVAAFVVAYNNVGWFKDGVDAVFSWLAAVWNDVILPGWNAGIQVVRDIIGVLVEWFNTYLMPGIMAIGEWFAGVISNVQDTWRTGVAIMTVIIAGLMLWWNENLAPAIDAVAGWFQDMGRQAGDFIRTAVDTVLRLFGQLADWWNTTLGPIIDTVAGWFRDTITSAIDAVAPYIQTAMDNFAKLGDFLNTKLAPVAETIGGIFEAVGDAISTAAGHVGDFLSNPLGGIADWMGIEMSGGGVVGMAGGGVAKGAGGLIGGYAPGKDRVPAMLSPGEGVAVPELVRAIGAKNFMALNSAFSGGRKAGSGPTPSVGSGSGRGGGGGTQVIFNEGAITVAVTIEGGDDFDPDEIKDAVKEAVDEALYEAERRSY